VVSWAGVSGSPVAWGTGGLTLIAVSAATAIGGGLNHVLWLVSLEDLLAGGSWSAHWDWLWAGSWKGGVAWDHLDSWGVSAESGGGSHVWSPHWVLPHVDDSWLGLLNNNLLWLFAGIKAGTAGTVGVSVALSVCVSTASVSVSTVSGFTSLAWSLSELSISPLLTLGEVVSSEGSEESVVAVLPSGVTSSDAWLWLVALLLVSASITASGLAVLASSGEGAGLSVSTTATSTEGI